MAEAASVYRACGRHGEGLGPRQVDELEFWEIAAFLGVDVPPEKTAAPLRSGGGTPSTGKRDLLAERVAYSQGRGPKPEPDEPDQSMIAFMGEMDRTL